jgi:DUF1009 family protein
VPIHVAEAAVAQGRPVLVIGIDGEADRGIERFPHVWLSWGQIGKLQKLLEGHGGRDMVLIGSIRSRPDFKKLKLDFGAIKSLPEILAIIVGGDSDVLSATVKFFERRGFRIVGAHEVARDLVAPHGSIGRHSPGEHGQRDAAIAMRAARAIGAIDAGQAAVAVNGRVVALEAAEGTDAVLARVGELRAARRLRWEGRAGVLAKCVKPRQDLRVDMPTIGPKTVEAVIAAGLAGIAVEVGRVMIIDREQVVKAADQAGLFIVGVRLPGETAS